MDSEATLLSDLTVGDRFLHDNKLHIKTNTFSDWYDGGFNNCYCVEFYSGKLLKMPLTSIVKRSN